MPSNRVDDAQDAGTLRRLNLDRVLTVAMNRPGAFTRAELSDEQVGKLGAKRPRILALCAGAMPVQVDLRRIFERQLLVAAVISRTNAPAQATAGSAQEAFDQMFKVITPPNVSELPPLAVARP